MSDSGVLAEGQGRGPGRWRLSLALFVATVLSTLMVGAEHVIERSPWELAQQALPGGLWAALRAFAWGLGKGWLFAVPLMSILVVHEFGHYLMARWHRVPASLPMFIPFPNLFGTMGAVIAMPGRIRTRDALVDIGAAGPLAGLSVAIPVTALGLSLSRVESVVGRTNIMVEGDSLLYLALKRAVVGPIADGYDVWLHPVALAGWAGFFVTMMNLLPVGQLDGGHVAYALFGRRADRASRWVLGALMAHALGVALWCLWRARWHVGAANFTPAIIWGMWALMSRGVMRLSGDAHPPTNDDEASPGRKVVAVLSLVCFVLLFMPLPIQLK
ncbi:MAG: site-2 protease family protein [Myxococcales bacterium]|nr:site-2 protease family protein [Myxococcales bacterium]